MIIGEVIIALIGSILLEVGIATIELNNNIVGIELPIIIEAFLLV